MGVLLSSLRCRWSALHSRWIRWLPRWPWARTPCNHQSLCNAEEGESRAHISTPNRPQHKPPRAEEESKAHVPTPERPRHCAGAESKVHVPTPKRRALLIGTTYDGSTDPIWTPLVGPHVDVDHFQELLIRVYFIHRVSSGN
jgi:hypothetical protein